MMSFQKGSASQQGTSSKTSSKYISLMFLLVVAISLMGATLVLLERQDSVDKAYFALTTEQRLLAQSIITYAREASQGRQRAFDPLKVASDRFTEILNIQRSGDSQAGLPASPSTAMPYVAELTAQWQSVRAGIDIILNRGEAVLAVRDFKARFEGLMPQLRVLSDEITRGLIEAGAHPEQIYIATRQLMLIQRMQQSLERMLAGEADMTTMVDQFGRDMTLFGRILAGMVQGDSQLGIDPVVNTDNAAQVAELAELFSPLEEGAERALDYAPELFQVQNVAQDIASQGDALHAAIGRLLAQYTSTAGTVEILGVSIDAKVAYAFGILALILLAMLNRQQARDAQRRLDESERRKQESEEQNRRNQAAILRLLDEMGDLAQGDLTVQANVTEDLTGAIADAINYAVEALRDLVTTINDTSEQVASAAQETRAIADRLAKASEVQARQIDSSSRMVVQMAHSMDEVSNKTATSVEVAQKSVAIAHAGGDRVRHTIQGMDAIREHIQETSKRIKRLGESSQEIGDIVELINDIADQTNILALNAAIQAAAAGEAGRGFAVVADEVQRLAERCGGATKRIETLVKTIQADTHEAIHSMEKSTTEVINGAELAEKAGESLGEIETVSARLAVLIDEISHATRQVADMADRVSTTMISINEITTQTAEGSTATASSIGKLIQLSQALRQSVAGFQLPDQEKVLFDHKKVVNA